VRKPTSRKGHGWGLSGLKLLQSNRVRGPSSIDVPEDHIDDDILATFGCPRRRHVVGKNRPESIAVTDVEEAERGNRQMKINGIDAGSK
jgi:hypothetical protein